MLDYIESHVDITELSNFKTPARSQYYFQFSHESQLELLWKIFAWVKDNNIPILIISWGTNMLFAFDEYSGIVIHNNLSWWTYDEDSKQLFAYGRESIWDIATKLEYDYGQVIWHRFIGLPWSIAWAIYGNAGCFWLETENNFLSCKVLDTQTGYIHHFSKDDMNFWYRSSILKQDKKYFLISAVFDLSRVVEKYSSEVDNVYFRQHVQPQGNCCGSFFKNPVVSREVFIHDFPELSEFCPKNISAWFLLEQVWLKWYKYGGAFFSEKHANFLMNDGSWTWQELMYLVELAQKKVYETFSLRLENEVQIISK